MAVRYAAAADGLALAVALLWVVHPLQTESVTYIYQRMESLMGLFYLLTLYCFVRSASSPRPRLWMEAAVLCCAAGMDSKEVMVTAPLLVLWYDRVFVAEGWRDLFRRRWRFYAALAATWIILYAVMRCQSDRYRELDSSAMPRTAWDYALNQPIVILHYLRLTFFPRGLCLHYLWPGAATTREIVAGSLALAAILAATAWCVVRRPALGFVAGSFFLVLAVTSSVVPVFDMIFEHRMYLSLAAVATMVVLGGYDLLGLLFPLPPGSLRRQMLHVLPMALIVVALTATTYVRNFAYSSYVGMWQDIAEKAPGNGIAQKNLGLGFAELHRYEESITAFRRALALADSMAVVPSPALPAGVYNNLGASLANTGRLAEAMHCYEDALRLDPTCSMAYVNMGTLFGKLREPALRGNASKRRSSWIRVMRRRITTWVSCWKRRMPRPPAVVIKLRSRWTPIMALRATPSASFCCAAAIDPEPSNASSGRWKTTPAWSPLVAIFPWPARRGRSLLARPARNDGRDRSVVCPGVTPCPIETLRTARHSIR